MSSHSVHSEGRVAFMASTRMPKPLFRTQSVMGGSISAPAAARKHKESCSYGRRCPVGCIAPLFCSVWLRFSKSQDRSRCHHGKSSTPGQEKSPCSHQQIAAGSVDKGRADTSVSQVVQFVTYTPTSAGFYIAKSGPVGSADLSPPPFHLIAHW